MRLDSNIKSKSLNNTYLNIIEICTRLFKNKHHRIAKFGSNVDFEKRVILSELENLCHLLEKLSAAPTLTEQHLKQL